jgi:23S rRNA-/tRNA-specific pseudouridylate synthase
VSEAGESFWATLPLGTGVKLLHRDANGLAAFAKPAGVLSHPNEPRDQPRSLLDASYDAEGEFFTWPLDSVRSGKSPTATAGKGGVGQRLWLLNRLDSATSGVILAAANEKLAGEIRALFQRRYVKKIYNALVFGIPAATEQMWRDSLAVQKKGGVIRSAASGNVPAEAQVRLIRSVRGARPLSLIELAPKTGRSHQLRVQCAKRHLPIVGDATYGDFRANREFAKASGQKRMFLHSRLTAFEYTFGGRSFRFSAEDPLPKEFEATLER